MRKTHLLYALVIAAVLAVFAGCTSSTTSVRTNPGYEQDYTQTTRSRQASSSTGDSQFPQEVYHPPITLSMLAMETGEVLKGEAYPVVAIVDNPEKRELKYKWSVEAGVLAGLPESRRSEVTTWEQKLRDAKGLPGTAKTEATLETPADASLPASEPSTSAAGPQAPAEGAAPPPLAAPGGQQPPALAAPEKPADKSKTAEASKPADETKPADTAKVEGIQVSMATMKYALLAPEDENGGEQTWPEPEEKAAEEAVPADEATAPESSEEAKPAEEEAAGDAGASAGEVDEKVAEVTEESGELQGFQPKATEGKLVEMPAEKEESEEGDDILDEVPPLVTVETDQPYVLWTPPDLGSYTITCVVVDKKGNELTPVRSFPVTVTEPTPKSEIVWNTTEKLNEEDFLVAEIRLKNITNYSKGLFTVAYDPAKLSFRLVEPGDFFPKDTKISLYYAQPPGDSSKVTLAISVDQLDLPQGEGVAARVIFKVKEDIADPASLNITQVTTEEARYILDAEGKNILPAIPDNPIYATEWTEPPAPPTQERPSASTGSQLPATPEPPGGTKRDQLLTGAQSGAPGAATPLAPSTSGASQITQNPAQNPQLTVLEAQKQTILSDQSMSAEERNQKLLEIDQKIRDLISSSK